jgi:hypothetical protein
MNLRAEFPIVPHSVLPPRCAASIGASSENLGGSRLPRLARAYPSPSSSAGSQAPPRVVRPAVRRGFGFLAEKDSPACAIANFSLKTFAGEVGRVEGPVYFYGPRSRRSSTMHDGTFTGFPLETRLRGGTSSLPPKGSSWNFAVLTQYVKSPRLRVVSAKAAANECTCFRSTATESAVGFLVSRIERLCFGPGGVAEEG